MISVRVRSPLAFLVVAGLMISGCGGGEAKSKERPTVKAATPSTSAPPIVYTEEHLKRTLVTPKEVGRDMKPLPVAVRALKEGAAPMCSLSAAKAPGGPQITTRQFINPNDRLSEPKYGQFFARYDDPQQAATGYTALTKKALTCPKKRHVPPRRISANFTLFEHDDTWKVSQDSLSGWDHLRGFEKHLEPPSATKRNVFYFIYDYAVRGNVVIATLYWERTEPKDSADPIAKRATALLIKQLQKIG